MKFSESREMRPRIKSRRLIANWQESFTPISIRLRKLKSASSLSRTLTRFSVTAALEQATTEAVTRDLASETFSTASSVAEANVDRSPGLKGVKMPC